MSKQRGVTLIELTLALAVIAAILLGVTRVYRIVDNSHKVTSAANMILMVYQAAAQWGDNLPVGSDLIQEFSENGYLLSEFKNSGANPWGGDIKADAPNGYTLHVELTNVPSTLCNNLSDKFKNMQNAQAVDCIVTDRPTEFEINFDMGVSHPQSKAAVKK